MYFHRTLESHILRLSESFPVLIVTGPRQVGKTTLLQHLAAPDISPRNYVSLDEFGPRALAQEDPELFLQRYRPPLIIDEIQNAPQLLTALKPRIDREKEPGAYWLTGSQHLPLMRNVSESLAGRAAIIELAGLSQAEEWGWTAASAFRPDRVKLAPSGPDGGTRGATPSGDLLNVFERIVRGSFPRLAGPAPPPRETFYGSYLQTYLERDLRVLANISNLAAFQRFLRLAAARVGQLLNFSDLARDTGIAVSTAREWLHLLEATFQVYLLRPYFENIGKRQIKTPKLYFRDTGLVCYLTGWTSAETAASGAMAGHLLENYVLSELLKSYRHRGRDAPFWFFRDKQKNEVDLVIAEDGQLFPIEIKLTASPGARHLKGFERLQRSDANLGHGAVICLADSVFPITATADAVPVTAIV